MTQSHLLLSVFFCCVCCTVLYGFVFFVVEVLFPLSVVIIVSSVVTAVLSTVTTVLSMVTGVGGLSWFVFVVHLIV